MRIAAAILRLTSFAICFAGTLAARADQPIAELVSSLKQAGPDNAGQAAAREAWAKLAAVDASQLPTVLAALDDAGPLAANWIRSSADAIVERAERDKVVLPRADIERFLSNAKHASRARRLAYEILLRGDPALADRVLPKMLDDPSAEMRRDAVARAIQAAERVAESRPDDKAGMIAAYRRAFDAARDVDQVKTLAERLKHLDEKVDLPDHFGFITAWQVIGPFDNRDKKGFAAAYPPEAKIDLLAAVAGKDGDVKWHPFTTTDDFGQVDLNKAIGKHLGALAYATTEFNSDRARSIELRLGTENACKLWLNGKQLLASEVYHSFSNMDQFVVRGDLKAGSNVILLKVCQNEQTEDWAQVWQFQLRVCDLIGQAILSQAGNRKAAATAGGGR